MADRYYPALSIDCVVAVLIPDMRCAAIVIKLANSESGNTNIS